MDRQTVIPFLAVAGFWLALSAGLCIWFSRENGSFWPSLGWLALLWSVCLTDLYSLSRAVGALLEQAGAEGSEKHEPLKIQAFYWGLVKLLCLGILGTILFYGSSIPSVSLLTGTGTLVVVPLVGGYRWSQKVLRHA